MAITAIEYGLLTFLRQNGNLPTKPHVLEFGEANWFGDMPVQQLANDIEALVGDESRKKHLLSELEKAQQNPGPYSNRQIAKIFYSTFLDQESLTAIDLYGSDEALALDVNQPLALGKQFDICFDFGTSEHVFNLFQLFKSVHEATKPGGLMVHGTALSGWYDQGFYNFKPEYYWTLAEKNGYEMLAIVYAELYPLKMVEIQSQEDFLGLVKEGQISGNSLLYAVMKKPVGNNEFQISPR
jgi:SAM-dependent methyltransferase